MQDSITRFHRNNAVSNAMILQSTPTGVTAQPQSDAINPSNKSFLRSLSQLSKVWTRNVAVSQLSMKILGRDNLSSTVGEDQGPLLAYEVECASMKDHPLFPSLCLGKEKKGKEQREE